MNSSPMQLNNSEKCYITCSGRTDGVGAQIQAMLSTLLFSHDLEINYVHTPLSEISHKQKTQINEYWENFFGIAKDEIKISEITNLNLTVVNVQIDGLEDPIILSLKETANALFVVIHCHYYADMNSNNYKRLKQKLLEKYYSKPKDKYKLDSCSNKINIAVHIRRGDVSKEKYPNRFADILIMAKSSFSYSAALFSNRVKIYEPFWHKPQNDWVVADDLAQFNEED